MPRCWAATARNTTASRSEGWMNYAYCISRISSRPAGAPVLRGWRPRNGWPTGCGGPPMPPEPVTPRAGDPWVQTAVILWIAVLAVICIRVAIYPHKRTLYTTWEQAGSDWENGRDLYRNTWDADK